MTSQQLPPGRYGSRARTRSRPLMRWLLLGIGVIGLFGVSVLAYNNLGNPPIQGSQASYQILDDRSVHVTIEVQRDQPQRVAECVVRARAQNGDEVGRKEVLIPPAEGTVLQDTVVRTSTRAVTGEVYGCSYDVPEYLRHATRPTG